MCLSHVFQVTHVLAHNLLARFKELMLKVDPTQKRWQSYLMATCRHFNTAKLFDLLLEFQVGTCDMLYCSNSNYLAFHERLRSSRLLVHQNVHGIG